MKRCSICDAPQFETPGGISCAHGHGGAAGYEDDEDEELALPLPGDPHPGSEKPQFIPPPICFPAETPSGGATHPLVQVPSQELYRIRCAIRQAFLAYAEQQVAIEPVPEGSSPLKAGLHKLSSWHRVPREIAKDVETVTAKLLPVPLTPEELAAVIADAVADLEEDDRRQGTPKVHTASEFTCYSCTAATRCPFAFAPYNTDGDCIASK